MVLGLKSGETADMDCSLCYKDRWISARNYVLVNALVTVTFLVMCIMHVIDMKGMVLVMCIMQIIDPNGMITVIIKALFFNPFTSLSNSVHHPHFIYVSSVLV